jgi:cytochrome c-type biogenesis protein CcmE
MASAQGFIPPRLTRGVPESTRAAAVAPGLSLHPAAVTPPHEGDAEPMNAIRTKLLIAGVILAGAVGYLAFAGVQSGWVYYLPVDQFVADTQFHGTRVRLHGTVATDGFAASAGTLVANFQLQGESRRVSVAYRGVVPDLFKAGGDVVVEGRLDDAGVFQADVLMTKCASKYEPGSPHDEKRDGGDERRDANVMTAIATEQRP